jgi:uncharacterized protein (TIGR02147 family)
MKALINYTDFRAYLNDWITERKQQGLPGSNRWFAMKMEINSTSWLTSILKGVKGLSKETTNKLSQILKHSPMESRYFETLVLFNQARTVAERNQYYQDLTKLQNLKEIRKITANQYDLYSVWYHTVIRSLVGMHPFKSSEKDFELLASMISPPITVSQARKSVNLLLDLDIIRINDHDYFELTSTAITTGENIQSLAVANFQQETLRLAQEAIDRYNRSERYIGTITIGVSEQAFSQIKQLLIETSNKIAEIANADANAERVYQINLQAFPLSSTIEKNGQSVVSEYETNHSGVTI